MRPLPPQGKRPGCQLRRLHLYESLGWHRAGMELRKVHFAEEVNEVHHLQIMEALGGDQLWIDRFIAQHAAVLYFWWGARRPAAAAPPLVGPLT